VVSNNIAVLKSITMISDKEKELIELKARGFTDKKAARAMFRSPKSIEKMLSRLYEKTDCPNANALINWAWEQEILKRNRENLPQQLDKTG
jgi:DNA-binding CsgD family transcriptional regulator